MYLETVGTATAAAGGLVLRQAFKVSVANTNTRTITVGGSSSGIINAGDIHGPATMTVETPRKSTPTPPSAGALPPPPKRPAGMIIFGTCLIRRGIPSLAERLARIAYDVRALTDNAQNPLTWLLVKAVTDDVSSARLFTETMQNGRPSDLLPALLAASRRISSSDDEPTIARLRLLGRYSYQLSDAGEFDQALAVSQRTLAVARELEKRNLDPDRRHLADSLIARSNFLARARRSVEALKDIEEAVEIRRTLAATSPAEFRSLLGGSLQNLSSRRAEAGDQTGADDPIKEAYDLFSALTAEDPARHNRELARTMHNYGARQQENGDRRGAVLALRDAVRLHFHSSRSAGDASKMANRAQRWRWQTKPSQFLRPLQYTTRLATSPS